MGRKLIKEQAAALALAAVASIALSACGGNQTPTAPPAAADTAARSAATDQPAAATDSGTQTLTPTDTTWMPEAMEELLAPVALYPDFVLGQVLVASTNPQEVLDAGNWLLQNQTLQGKALDEAAKKVGFTASMRGLLQSPEVVDMLCSQMDWTTELGQAFVNDQAGVLDAVQRLRAQAKDVGNLKSSDQMKVETQDQEGKEVVTISPPNPQVVYVPQYDPVAVYAPPPAAATTTPTTTTAAATTADTGHSTGALVATGLLSFGAGLLVANILDDDDEYYSPRYYGPPMPYYPPYPYRPRYGSGYYPSNGYNRPPNYQHGFNNNTIIVNQDNNYWNNRNNNRGSGERRSPISQARPNRPELESLNSNARNAPKREAQAGTDSWKGKDSYAGAKPGVGNKRPDTKSGRANPGGGNLPKVQGSYAGAKPAVNRGTTQVDRPAARPATTAPSRPAGNTQRMAAEDRGRAASQASKPAASRPSSISPASAQRAPSSAVSANNRSGSSARAASERGRQSMPGGVPPKAKSAPRPARR